MRLEPFDFLQQLVDAFCQLRFLSSPRDASGIKETTLAKKNLLNVFFPLPGLQRLRKNYSGIAVTLGFKSGTPTLQFVNAFGDHGEV
ncbi:protein of unknown function [Hyphomicrobium sp. 1Nfss2.1]